MFVKADNVRCNLPPHCLLTQLGSRHRSTAGNTKNKSANHKAIILVWNIKAGKTNWWCKTLKTVLNVSYMLRWTSQYCSGLNSEKQEKETMSAAPILVKNLYRERFQVDHKKHKIASETWKERKREVFRAQNDKMVDTREVISCVSF